MNKHFSIRFLACLTVLVAAISLLAPAVLADSGKETPHMLTMNIRLDSNVILARYGLKVYLDNEELDHLPQGGRLLKIRNVSDGIHTIRISTDKSGVPDMSFDICVRCETTLTATLKTHRKYVGIEDMTVTIPDREITFSEGSGSWDDFMEELILLAALNEI